MTFYEKLPWKLKPTAMAAGPGSAKPALDFSADVLVKEHALLLLRVPVSAWLGSGAVWKNEDGGLE